MKLPSVNLLFNSLLFTLRRFPIMILSTLLGTISEILFIEGNFSESNEIILLKTIMTCLLGLPLFFSLHIFFERIRPQVMYVFIAFVVAFGMLIQFYFTIQTSSHNFHNPVLYRYFFWSAGLHLIAAFSAFFIYEEINGFWQFNKTLFLRFLLSVLYSVVLFLGLSGAILAVQTLFNVDVHEKIYGDLWVIIAGLFNTLFFLGGIPQPISQLNNETSYPKGLKLFTQYVLLTLVTIYLAILYAYAAKIVVDWSLPKGWVANLIFGFSVAGIFSLLLIYPVREQEGNRWMKTFSHFFYYSLIPLIVLLFVAIGTRIVAYGVTIERYIVAMLGIWLAVVTLYFIFSKQKNIILIPLTLSLFLFASLIGPWGMFQVSERSQLARLQKLLEKNGALVNGKFVTLAHEQSLKVKINDLNQINSVLDYLFLNHTLDGIRLWSTDSCLLATKANKHITKAAVLRCIGLPENEYNSRSDENESEIRYNLYCSAFNRTDGIEVAGYDYIYEIDGSETPYNKGYVDSNRSLSVLLRNNVLKVYRKGHYVYSISLDSITEALRKDENADSNNSERNPSSMTFELTTSNNTKTKLMLSSYNFVVKDSGAKVEFLYGYMLVKR